MPDDQKLEENQLVPGAWLDKCRDERNEAQNRIHLMKGDLDRATGRYKKLCASLEVDPEDQQAVEHLIADLKGFKRSKQRLAKGKLRSGEGISPDELRHYEAKLADKRARIRNLEAVNARLRAELAGESVDA
jgi:hypothetical protein